MKFYLKQKNPSVIKRPFIAFFLLFFLYGINLQAHSSIDSNGDSYDAAFHKELVVGNRSLNLTNNQFAYVDPSVIELVLTDAAMTDEVFHLFTHGRPGELLIENQWMDPIAIAKWIKQEGKLLNKSQLYVYGCNFAKGEKGKKAVAFLETTLDVSIAASNNLTGKDGDWILEVGQSIQKLELGSYAHNLDLSDSWDKVSNWFESFFVTTEEKNESQVIPMMMTYGGTVVQDAACDPAFAEGVGDFNNDICLPQTDAEALVNKGYLSGCTNDPSCGILASSAVTAPVIPTFSCPAELVTYREVPQSTDTYISYWNNGISTIGASSLFPLNNEHIQNI